VRGADIGWLDPVLGGTIDVDRCCGWHLRASYFHCIIECMTFASTLTISLQNSMYQNLNQICNIFIFRALNLWFVCVYL
jgi:hypothetical protein